MWRWIIEAVPRGQKLAIADGIGLGFLTYVVIKIIAGRRSKCSPTLVAVALLSAVKFTWL